MWSGNHKFYIQFSRLLRLQSFRITLNIAPLQEEFVTDGHFKNQAIKFYSILCFVNVDFDIIFVNRSVSLSLFYVFVIRKM
jgi:hypothetical protein